MRYKMPTVKDYDENGNEKKVVDGSLGFKDYIELKLQEKPDLPDVYFRMPEVVYDKLNYTIGEYKEELEYSTGWTVINEHGDIKYYKDDSSLPRTMNIMDFIKEDNS